ncbi:MAG TPA: hypothetical protein VE821_10885, partial [Pyrinomonadaceae bacterium]|nr:hypothetical protein [Pyrinomonadaceae bacterium]
VRAVDAPDDFAACEQTTLALTPDGRVLGACMAEEGGRSVKFKLWDLSAHGSARVLAEGPRADFALLGFSPGGRWLVASTTQDVKVYDTMNGTERQSFTIDKPANQVELTHGIAAAFAFSADEKFLALSAYTGAITIREIESGRVAQTLVGHSNLAYGVAFSPDGTRLVTGGRTVWDLTTGRGLRAGSGTEPFGLTSHDGRLLAAIRIGDSSVMLYDIDTQRRLFTLTPDELAAPPTLKAGQTTARRTAQVSALPPAFSPDARLLATIYTVSEDYSQTDQSTPTDTKALQKARREALKAMRKNPAAAVQAYNEAIAKTTAHRDTLANKIKLWDTQTGREVRTISVPSNNPNAPAQVKSVSFSPDGRTLAVVARDSPTITLWNVNTGAQVGTIGAAPA